MAKGRRKPKQGKKVTRDYLNNRNLDKPYRPMRTAVDKETGEVKFHPMDNMRLGNNGQAVNSTGCFGIKTTGRGTAGLSIIVKGKSGRPCNSKPKKNGGTDWKHVDWDSLVQRRARIHTKIMWYGINPKCKLSDIERKAFARLTTKIKVEKPQLWIKVKAQDSHRRACETGRIVRFLNERRKPGDPYVQL